MFYCYYVNFEKTDYNCIQRKVGITPSHHGSNGLGHTCATKFNIERNKYVITSKTIILIFSPTYTLKFGFIRPESQVIAYHHDTVNTYSGLAQTARHALGVCFTLSEIVL